MQASSPWNLELLCFYIYCILVSINHFGPVILELFCFCTTLWLWCFLNSFMRIRGGPHSSLPRHPSVVSQRPENHFDWADCVVGGGPRGGLEISKDKGSQACLFPVEIVQRLSRQINMVAAVSSGPKWEEQETCCSGEWGGRLNTLLQGQGPKERRKVGLGSDLTNPANTPTGECCD